MAEKNKFLKYLGENLKKVDFDSLPDSIHVSGTKWTRFQNGKSELNYNDVHNMLTFLIEKQAYPKELMPQEFVQEYDLASELTMKELNLLNQLFATV